MDRQSWRSWFWLLVFWPLIAPRAVPAQSAYIPADPTVVALPGTGGYPIRYTVTHDAGAGVGYEDSYTRLGMFLPLAESDGTHLLFTDLNVLIDNCGNLGSNLGLGYRFYNPQLERVFGIYAYVDYRDTNYNSFKQATLGLDSLGSLIDGRVNFYFPDQERQALPNELAAPPHFAGHHVYSGAYEQAMLGGDCELGLVLPPIWQIQTRLLAGCYLYDTDLDQDDEVLGVRVRAETHWTYGLFTNVAVNQDELFGTTVTVGLGVNWQPESYSPWRPRIQSFRRGPLRHLTQHASDRVAEPVWRQPNIAVHRGAYEALQGSTPWRFWHVVPGASGGDGSFERPFGRLEDALAVAGAGQVVYTPLGGSFQPSGMLTVPDGVSLLSQAPEQWIEMQAGWMQLPFSGASPDLSEAAEIRGSVTLGSSTTLRGFRLTGIGDTLAEAGMIRATGVSNVIIDQNVIHSRREGIWIEDTANPTVLGNQITQALGSGIRIAGDSPASVTGNRVEAATGHGIEILAAAGSHVAGNVIQDVGADGLHVNGVDGGRLTDNQVVGPVGDGIAVARSAAAYLAGNQVQDVGGRGLSVAESEAAVVTDNQIEASGGTGIAVSESASSQILRNTIQAAGGHGILAALSDGAIVRENAIDGAGGDGIGVDAGAEPQIDDNQIASVGGDGIRVASSDLASIHNNLIDGAGGHGISVRQGDATRVFQNQIGQTAGHGIEIIDGPAAQVSENQINNALGSGIRIQNADEAIVYDNTLHLIGGHGIDVGDSAGLMIVGNQLGTIDAGGIVVRGGEEVGILDNRIDFAGLWGISLDGTASVQIRGNEIREAIGNGIDIRAGDFEGYIQNNNVLHAQTGLQAVISGLFVGEVSGNLFSENRARGMYFELAGIGEREDEEETFIRSNRFEHNRQQGMSLVVTGTSDFALNVEDNHFVLNNEGPAGQLGEFDATWGPAAGPSLLRIGGNKSYNQVPGGVYNLDFVSQSATAPTIEITSPNLGTLGSSDGSVVLP